MRQAHSRPACCIHCGSLGLNYILNDETCAAFYRNLVRDGVGNGYALVSALMVGDEVVATQLDARLRRVSGMPLSHEEI